MRSPFHPHSPFRIFGFSVTASVLAMLLVYAFFGFKSLLLAASLVVIEMTFSFENAIINAKILQKMSRFWQQIFLTVGIVIAIFGMRIIFPIAIVAVTSGVPFNQVISMAINDPSAYSEKLDAASPKITAFGGAFLLMLAGNFFFNKTRRTHWLKAIEKPMQNLGKPGAPYLITLGVVTILCFAPANEHPKDTLVAGLAGVALYAAVHGLSDFFGRTHLKRPTAKKQVGLAALFSFLYLEVLDASFSLDGVIGAFAVTDQIALIVVGLGVGAIWVRSLTLFMVRKGTISAHKYLEHGAFYTVFILAVVLLLESVMYIPEAFAGIIGVVIIAASLVSSGKQNPRTNLSS